ncbi:MAG: hypothetical protein IJY25_04340 [Bacilli bacterium]|nr:hypothetical protein [Bacilli bacterium]
MNGNRGAKGSIKDRLISMLYRLRYKKKVQKEEDYKISNKEKQKDYLTTLQNFKEDENIEVLDKKDKKELEKIEFQAKFKVGNVEKINEKNIESKVIEIPKKSKGIELKLDSIESKTSELDEPLNLKKEIKKTSEEITILKEVDTFIKKSLDNIEEIKEDVEILKKESKIKNTDTENLEKRYAELKRKVEKLKEQYDTVKDKYDLSEFSILESIKLIDSISNYKTVASLNELDMMLNVCKKEIQKIDNIEVITHNKKTIGSNIDNIKKEQSQVKIKFKKSKENINSISNIEEMIVYELNQQKEIVDDMYEKASHFEKQISKKIELIGHRNILGSLFKIAGGILTLPLTGRQLFGVTLGSTMINKGLKEMNKKLETREKIVVDYKYEDISKQIEDVKDKVEYTNLVLSDSLNEIKKLKDNFKNVYYEYNEILSEYNSTLEKLNNLETKILKQQSKLLNMDKKLEQEKEMNKQKMKKIEEMRNS